MTDQARAANGTLEPPSPREESEAERNLDAALEEAAASTRRATEAIERARRIMRDDAPFDLWGRGP
jgi:hypothetical protein